MFVAPFDAVWSGIEEGETLNVVVRPLLDAGAVAVVVFDAIIPPKVSVRAPEVLLEAFEPDSLESDVR